VSFFYTSVEVDYNKILFRGYKDGKKIKQKIDYTPTLYVDAKNKTEYKRLDGNYVSPIVFASIKEAREFVKKYNGITNYTIYGNTNFQIQFISDVWNEHIDFDVNDIDIGTFDIEVAIGEEGFPYPDAADQEILTITYYSSKNKVYNLWGLKDYSVKDSMLDGVKIKFIKCDNEIDLLLKFLDFWQYNMADILSGWNIEVFDIPYLVNRIKKILSDEMAGKLSPWKKIEPRTAYDLNGNAVNIYNIVGIQQIDYLIAFKKFAYKYPNQESYTLGNIGFVVLKEDKLDYSEYKGLSELYEKNYQKFCDYNIKDVQLVVKLEEQLNLFYLICTIAYMAKCNLQDAFSPVTSWDSYIFNELRNRNIVIPPKKQNSKDKKIQGAYVKEPINGKYGWIVSFDATSLYPMLMIQSNMSPETIIDKFSRYTQLKTEAEKRGLM
jgi:DNA polymerase elongation subunit (family B)